MSCRIVSLSVLLLKRNYTHTYLIHRNIFILIECLCSKALKALHRHVQNCSISVNKMWVVVVPYFFLLESITQLTKQDQELAFSISHFLCCCLHHCRFSGYIMCMWFISHQTSVPARISSSLQNDRISASSQHLIPAQLRSWGCRRVFLGWAQPGSARGELPLESLCLWNVALANVISLEFSFCCKHWCMTKFMRITKDKCKKLVR